MMVRLGIGCLLALAFVGPVGAQESCEDALAWTRALTSRINQARSQTEIDLARAQVQAARLDADNQRLRQEIEQLRADAKKKKE